MRKTYSEFCSRHTKALKLYKELYARDKRFQQFIRVSKDLQGQAQPSHGSNPNSPIPRVAYGSCVLIQGSPSRLLWTALLDLLFVETWPLYAALAVMELTI
jgi:hypothetical protein